MFLDEIVDRLVSQGVGTFGVNIFVSSIAVIPPGDGPYLTLVETGGSGPARMHNGATQRPTAQITSRATTEVVSRAFLKSAYDALGGADGLHNITLLGVKYVSITPRQEPTDVGLDGEARSTFVFNIDAEKQPS